MTDRCNFRCGYCMPAEGLQWLQRSELLTFEEIERAESMRKKKDEVDLMATRVARRRGSSAEDTF